MLLLLNSKSKMNSNIGIVLPFIAALLMTAQGCQALTQINDFYSGTDFTIQQEPPLNCPPVKTPQWRSATKPSTSLSQENMTEAILHSMPLPSLMQEPFRQASPISIYWCSRLSRPAWCSTSSTSQESGARPAITTGSPLETTSTWASSPSQLHKSPTITPPLRFPMPCEGLPSLTKLQLWFF